MTNLEKYNQAFTECFGVSTDGIEKLTYQGISEWDSVGHMQLITAIEDAFDIMFDTEEIIDFNSYETGKLFMKNHDVLI